MTARYRKLDVGASNIRREIGRWAMCFPKSLQSRRLVLNLAVYSWFKAASNNYDPPGYLTTYRDMSKNTKLRGMCRKTISRASREWRERGVLIVDETIFDGTRGKSGVLIMLHPYWYDPEILEMVRADNLRELNK